VTCKEHLWNCYKVHTLRDLERKELLDRGENRACRGVVGIGATFEGGTWAEGKQGGSGKSGGGGDDQIRHKKNRLDSRMKLRGGTVRGVACECQL